MIQSFTTLPRFPLPANPPPTLSEMTKWLTRDEQVAWRAFLHGTSLLFERLDQELQSRSGLSSTDYEILVFLSESDDHRLRMSELADSVLVSRSRLTYRVDQLAKRGLVIREACEEDARGMNARLTAEGMALLESAAPGHVDDVRRLLIDAIPAERLSFFTELFQSIGAAASTTETSDEADERPGRP